MALPTLPDPAALVTRTVPKAYVTAGVPLLAGQSGLDAPCGAVFQASWQDVGDRGITL